MSGYKEGEHEVTIKSIENNKITFDLFYYRLYGEEDIVATINENGKANFNIDNKIKGYIEFSSNELYLTYTNVEEDHYLSVGTEVFKRIADNSVPNSSSVLPSNCQQAVFVDTASSKLILYNKNGDTWNPILTASAKFGRKGTTTLKKEGDGKTPLGVFDIGFYFGLKDCSSSIRFFKVDENTIWIDDSNSYYYNTISEEEVGGDWDSYEKLYDSYFKNNIFNYCIYFESNGDGINGGSANADEGSLITICGKNTTLTSTSGCIDISGKNMEKLLKSLDISLNPVVVIE